MTDDAGGAPADPAMAMNTATMGAPTGMSRMLGQPPMVTTSNGGGGLPAALGAPHLYHAGADTFFLDQATAIALTPEQQTKLKALKENASTTYATTQRKIDQGEQDLWVLTSSEQPNAMQIESKIGEITRLGGQQRMDFIRAIGNAVGTLTEAQRKAMASQTMASTQMSAMSPATSASGMNMGGASGGTGMGKGKGMGGMDEMKPKMKGMGGMDPAASGGMGHM